MGLTSSPSRSSIPRQTPSTRTAPDIHAANRHALYRNRSLWMLLQPILQFPDPQWVQRLVRRIATAAPTVTSVDFEELLPLGARGVRARHGDLVAARVSRTPGSASFREPRRCDRRKGRTDSRSHYQRRASSLAEVLAVAHDRRNEADDLLRPRTSAAERFRGLPRTIGPDALAESTRIARPDDGTARELALTSARAASHRIQDHRFCLQMTAMVNAYGPDGRDMTAVDLPSVVERFLDNPVAAEFCAFIGSSNSSSIGRRIRTISRHCRSRLVRQAQYAR